jgi:hypothetical protein
MSAPTVRGRPWFNTAGHYVNIRVRIDNDPPHGVTATYVRAWGESSVSDKTCLKYKGSAKPKIKEPIAELPWNSDDYSNYSEQWFHYDPECRYYRICAEVTLSNGEEVNVCYVWEVPADGDEEFSEEVFADC